MAAQRTEKEDTTEFKPLPDQPPPLSLSSSSSAPPRRFSSVRSAPARPPIQTSQPPADVSPPAAAANRCHGCRRKVGLTGIRCRCGDLFCSEHRYSDRHVCSYDYKSAGREMIARENPLVKAAKIIKL